MAGYMKDKVNLCIIEMVTKQDVEALKEYSKKTRFKLYSFEDIFVTKYDSKAKFNRYWRILKNLKIKKIPRYIYHFYSMIRYPYNFSFDNVRKLSIEKLTFENFKKGTDKYNIKGFIIPAEHPFLNNIILWSKETGIKIIVVSKEHVMAPESKSIKKWVKNMPFRCDLMCCGGEVLANYWKGRLSKKEKKIVKVTGIPKFDKYFKGETMSRKEFCKILNLDPKKKIIFFPSFKNFRTEKVYNLKNINKVRKPSDLSFFLDGKVTQRKDHRPLKNDIIGTMHKIVKENSNVQAIVKLHPDQQPNKQLSTKYEIAAVAGKIPNLVGIIGKPEYLDGRDIVANSDLIVGYESTMLFEGLLLKKPILVQRWDLTKGREDIYFYESGACDGAKNKEEFYDKILWILKNTEKYVKKHNKARERFIYKFIYKSDGKACERVFKEIDKFFTNNLT